MIVTSIICFTILFHFIKYFIYFKTNISKTNMHTIASSIVSSIHAILVSLHVLFVYYNLPNEIYDNPNIYTNSNNNEFVTSIKFTTGYMIYDLFWMIYYKNQSVQLLIHHITTIVACTSAIISPYGRYVTFLSILNEISTPFLNFNVIVSILSKHNLFFIKPYYKQLNLILFTMSFFICRIVLLSYLFYQIITTYDFTNTIINILVFLYSIHYMLNLYWFRIINQKIMKSMKND